MRASLASLIVASLFGISPAIAQSGGVPVSADQPAASSPAAMTHNDTPHVAPGPSRREDAGSPERASANCARRPELRARYGENDARIVKIEQLCRTLGY